MPFESDSQRRFMYSQHPEIAKRWRKESGPQTGLPEKKGKSKGNKVVDGLKKAAPKDKKDKY
jgi:hypothetical protein